MFAEGPTRDQVRDVATEVFRRGEFQRHKSLLQRIIEWIEDLFDGNQVDTTVPSAGGGSALGQLLLYLLLAVLVVILVWLLVRAARGRIRSTASDEPEDASARIEEERAASEWRSDAARAEAEGRWKDAMRDRYRELVAGLMEARALPDVPGRTTGELRLDIVAHLPAMADRFSEACLLFELPWYADLPTGPDENARIRALSAEILAAGVAAKVPRADAVEVSV